MEIELKNTISLMDVYRELKRIEQNMVTKTELNNAIETLSVLSNEETMKQIEKSEEDIKRGRIKRINSVNDI